MDQQLSGYTAPICPRCKTDIATTEEVWVLNIMQLVLTQGGPFLIDLLDEEGQHKYPPLTFDCLCWEYLQDELQELLEHGAGYEKDDEGVLLCDICNSDVLLGEVVGVLRFGEYRRSTRSPNRHMSIRFVQTITEERHICVGCLHHLDGAERLWEEQGGVEVLPGRHVCLEGLHDHCWREGNYCACERE